MNPAAPSAWSSAGEALSRWAILAVLAVLYLVAIALSDAFLEPVYVGNILRQAAPVGIAAIGTTLVMILGCIDLSIGAINGVLVVFNRSSSFILTLGTALAIYGLTQIFSGGTARGMVAPDFREFFNQRIGDVLPVLALALLLLAAAVEALLRTTRFGRQIYLIGSNREAARLSGLPVAGVTFACYVISGLFAAMGGIAVLARSGVSSTFTGRGFEFDALAAIVLGGTLFSGGRGTVVGTVAGTLVLFIAFNLVNILGFNYNLQLVLKGAIIVVASAAYARLGRDR